MRVVLVHGILDSGRKFRRMQQFLEARGHCCLAPSLEPNDGRDGLEGLAEQLRRQIDGAWGAQARFALVGYSMGGLIARWFLQELRGADRVDRFFAISVPMRGSLLAYGYPGRGARQMRPGSALLRRLDETADRLAGVALFGCWTPFDAVILPPSSANWPLAEMRRVPALCHPCMLSHPLVLEQVAAGLADRLD